MRHDSLFRLYLTLVLVLSVVLFAAPLAAIIAETDLRDKLFRECIAKMSDPESALEICSLSTKAGGILPLWQYLIQFLPPALLLWANWVFKFPLRFAPESWPSRIYACFLFFGVLCGIGSAVLPVWYAISTPSADVDYRSFLMTPYLLTGPLLAPLFFRALLSPVPPSRLTLTAWAVLLLAVVAPFIAFGISFAKT